MFRIPDRRSVLRLLAGSALVVGVAFPGAAGVLYQNDFESPVGPEWSTAERDTTPLEGRVFLGQFSGPAAILDLSGLPPHTDLTLSFEIFVILTWDGNFSDVPTIGPDLWDVSVTGGPTLLHTTFSNGPPGTSQPPQAYPEEYPGGSHTFMSGAAETYTLGYMRSVPEGVMDAVYDLSFSFPHSASSLEIVFSTSALQGIADEAWGLDNVRLETESATGVHSSPAGAAIATVRLLAASPNPALSATRLSFELDRGERVALSVFRADGTLIRRFARGELTAGRHDFTWDGRDDSGRTAPAGVYFVRLDAGRQSLGEKIVRLR